MTPPGSGSYKIWVPAQFEALFADAHDKLKGLLKKRPLQVNIGYEEAKL